MHATKHVSIRDLRSCYVELVLFVRFNKVKTDSVSSSGRSVELVLMRRWQQMREKGFS
jgi:hypothetical protein